MNYSDLVSALELIQNVCEAQSHCDECPLGNEEGYCLVAEKTPARWNIVEPKTIIRILE